MMAQIENYHVLTGMILILFLVVLSLMLAAFRRRSTKEAYEENSAPTREKKRVIEVSNRWGMFNIVLLSVHYFLNGMSVYCSVITAYIGSVGGKNSDVVLYSILSITFLFVDLLMHPKEKGYGYRIAYERSERAMQEYFCQLIEWSAVLETMAECEKIIGKSLYDATDYEGNEKV